MIVMFWHKLCLLIYRLINFKIMKKLKMKYEAAKNKANMFMKNGEISQYFETLLEMNRYKKLMVAIVN